MEHHDIWLAIYEAAFAACDFSLLALASAQLDSMEAIDVTE